MKSINLDLCIKYQMCFFHKGYFSPFEFVEDYKTYFPLAIIGELGSILNVYCKTYRSPNIYTPELADECADTFIYLLIYGLYIKNKIDYKVLDHISDTWLVEPAIIKNDFSLCSMYDETVHAITLLPHSIDKKSKLPETFEKIFNNIKAINGYVLHQNWQATIDSFHEKNIQMHSEISSFTPDYKYKGACWLNVKRFLDFIKEIDFQLPIKRLSYLESIAKYQSKLLDE